MEKDFYVYVYIDPRNSKEFYIGKGKDNRKLKHRNDGSDTNKVNRINEIRQAGLEPIIRVIARNLSEEHAFLVEKTLIWKLHENLTNESSGSGGFANNFRPYKTLDEPFEGYDFKNGIYYVNVSEGPHRCWDDCKNFGFLSAGQDKKWSDPIKTLEKGDIVVAYLQVNGYVGIGRVIEKAKKVNDFLYNGLTLNHVLLKQINIFQNSDNGNSEYLVKIEWIKTLESKDAKWESNSGLFTNQNVKASLEKQEKTKEYLETEFNIKFKNLYEPRIEIEDNEL